jgi:hypothetical protein
MSNKSPKHSRPNKPPKRPKAKDDSSQLGTVLSIVGLLIAVISLVTLRPQVSVSPAEALQHSQPFSVPFHITNSSFYAIDQVTPTFYIHRLMVGGVDLGKNLNQFSETKRLEHGETGTILCEFVETASFPQEADVVVVVDYRIPWIPFWHPRQYFRFLGRYGDNWQWLAEPIGTVRREADAAFERSDQLRERFRLHPPGSH